MKPLGNLNGSFFTCLVPLPKHGQSWFSWRCSEPLLKSWELKGLKPLFVDIGSFLKYFRKSKIWHPVSHIRSTALRSFSCIVVEVVVSAVDKESPALILASSYNFAPEGLAC